MEERFLTVSKGITDGKERKSEWILRCWMELNVLVLLLVNGSVVSDSLRPHGLQHTRLPCPSPSPRACSNSCPSSQSRHPTISSSVIPFSCLQSFPTLGLFSNSSALGIMWPKYWSFSFSISPSNEYSVLISFRVWLAWSSYSPRDSQESSPTPQFKNINSSAQVSLWSNSHIHTWLLEKPQLWLDGPLSAK